MGIKEVILKLQSPYPLTVEEYENWYRQTNFQVLFKSELILYSYKLFSLYCSNGGFPLSIVNWTDKPKKIKDERELIRFVSKILNSPRAKEIAESIREWEMKERR